MFRIWEHYLMKGYPKQNNIYKHTNNMGTLNRRQYFKLLKGDADVWKNKPDNINITKIKHIKIPYNILCVN